MFNFKDGVKNESVYNPFINSKIRLFRYHQFRHTKDFPLQVNVCLTLHSAFRNKDLVDFFDGLCISIDYRQVIQIENKTANQMIMEMPSINCTTLLYVPRNFIIGRYIFFAIDNCDFKEDTADEKKHSPWYSYEYIPTY